MFAEDVYYHTHDNIQVITDEGTEVVFMNILSVEAMECNSNMSDHQIYWLEQITHNGALKRGFPGNENSSETVRLSNGFG